MPSRGCWPRTAPVALAAVPRASISASAHDGAAPASAAPLLLFAAATVRRRCCSGPALKFATNAMGVRHMSVQGGTEGKSEERAQQRVNGHAKKGSSDAPFFSLLQQASAMGLPEREQQVDASI